MDSCDTMFEQLLEQSVKKLRALERKLRKAQCAVHEQPTSRDGARQPPPKFYQRPGKVLRSGHIERVQLQVCKI